MQELPLTRASALAPQGLGLQGSLGGGGAVKKIKLLEAFKYIYRLETKHKSISIKSFTILLVDIMQIQNAKMVL